MDNPHFKKKFALTLTYRDENGKTHNKHVKFGNKTKEDYIDNNNEKIKMENQSRLRNT